MHTQLLLFSAFHSYGLEHFIWIALGVIGAIFWIKLGKRQSTELDQQRIGLIQSGISAAVWLITTIWIKLTEPNVDLTIILPFHISYFINLLLPFMLWRRSFFLFEITYYIVMGGCLQSLLTPALEHSFPHPFNFRFFYVHLSLLQSIFYAIFVYGFKPTWPSFGRAFLWANIYGVFVFGLNYLLGTNFLYLNRKPNTPSLLDLFGDWPWYIIGAETLCLMMYTLVMLPFAFQKPAENSTAR